MPGPNEALIARRAYEIWEGEGRPNGRDREHWLRAVEELSASIVADPVVLKPVRSARAAAPKAMPKGVPVVATAGTRGAVTAPARTKAAPAKPAGKKK